MSQRKMTLGMKDEVYGHVYGKTEQEELEIIAEIHRVMYCELLSRNILELWDWGTRARNVFLKNRLKTISDVVGLTAQQANGLMACGSMTRREIYEVCKTHGILLTQWIPEGYQDRSRYSFRQEEFRDRLISNGD